MPRRRLPTVDVNGATQHHYCGPPVPTVSVMLRMKSLNTPVPQLLTAPPLALHLLKCGIPQQ